MKIRPRKPKLAPSKAPPEFSNTATEADVRSCFRLLLGRTPQDFEWPGHVWRVGEDLASVVSSYLNSEEFAGRHLLGHSLKSCKLAQLSRFRLYASEDDTFGGNVIIRTGSYEPHVTRVFEECLRPGWGVLDIGANIGYFSMLAASLVGPTGWVQSWEPSPDNVKMLYASQTLNQFDNIEIVQAAASDKSEVLRYFHSASNGNVAEVTNILPEDILSSETVMGLRIDDFVPDDRQVSFVKIDVEGYEAKALRGALGTLRRCRPIVVSEFSPNSLQHASGVSGREYLDFFVKLDYELAVVSENAVTPGDVNAILSHYERSGTDHIDLLLRPKSTV